jgi:hypothetical protein
MKRRSFPSSARVALGGLVCWIASLSGRAELVFEKKEISIEMSVDDAVFVARYPFVNRGDKPVTITALEATCECTAAEVNKKTYGAGESGEIVARFEPGTRHGPQIQGVTVLTDAPDQPEELLILKAEIPEALALSRKVLLWKAGEAVEPKAFEVTTINGLSIREVRARAKSNHFETSVSQTGASKFEVKVTPNALAKNLSEPLHVDVVLRSGQVKSSSLYLRVR